MKATHVGTCQVCGREQKLPEGRLSKHGYSVQWGFFDGVCDGAHHLPFEQSKDLIERAIQRALDKVEDLKCQIALLRQPATEARATCHVYRGHQECRGRWEKPGYIWVSGKIEAREPRHGLRFVVIGDDGREWYIHVYREHGSPSELDAATYNNGQYADNLDRLIAQLTDYVAWQRKRIKDWAPQELKPIGT